jgi:hypothetical protein
VLAHECLELLRLWSFQCPPPASQRRSPTRSGCALYRSTHGTGEKGSTSGKTSCLASDGNVAASIPGASGRLPAPRCAVYSCASGPPALCRWVMKAFIAVNAGSV